MTSPEEFRDRMQEQEYVHDAVVIDDATVVVNRKVEKQHQPAAFTSTGWRVGMYLRDEHGDVMVFVPVNTDA